MQIPADRIEQIVQQTDLVALVSRYVSLKPSGRSLKGLCPFHAEKTPSFHVNPERRTFKCFGCDAGGDAISFLKRISGQSFIEVVRELAREANVHLDEREDPDSLLRRELRQVTALAQRFYEARLHTDRRAKRGLDYLKGRGVNEALARTFGLGYALADWRDLSAELARQGLLEQGVKAGLIAPNRNSEGYHDVFRGRLMVPIRSSDGHALAFGARLVEGMLPAGGNDGPKYLNSRESPLYRKSEVLFGLDRARENIRRSGKAVLVEGYFDVIGLHSAGIENAVALCSTALTQGHLSALVKADAKELILLLDGDAAGAKAIERLAAPLFASGLPTRIASLPPDLDPDEFANHYGAEAAQELLDEALPLSTHLLRRALPRGAASAYESKMTALNQLRPTLAQVPAGAARSMLLAELAQHFGVTEAVLRAELAVAHRPAARPKASAQRESALALDGAEALFAALLLFDESLRGTSEARLCDELRSPEVRMMLESENPMESLASLSREAKSAIDTKLTELERTLGGDEHRDARRRALGDAVARVRLNRLEEQIAFCTEALRGAGDQDPQGDDIDELQLELKHLFRSRQELKGRGTHSAGRAASP